VRCLIITFLLPRAGEGDSREISRVFERRPQLQSVFFSLCFPSFPFSPSSSPPLSLSSSMCAHALAQSWATHSFACCIAPLLTHSRVVSGLRCHV
jgi:hypothetical protein